MENAAEGIQWQIESNRDTANSSNLNHFFDATKPRYGHAVATQAALDSINARIAQEALDLEKQVREEIFAEKYEKAIVLHDTSSPGDQPSPDGVLELLMRMDFNDESARRSFKDNFHKNDDGSSETSAKIAAFAGSPEISSRYLLPFAYPHGAPRFSGVSIEVRHQRSADDLDTRVWLNIHTFSSE
jgi:hypothetical protein